MSVTKYSFVRKENDEKKKKENGSGYLSNNVRPTGRP